MSDITDVQVNEQGITELDEKDTNILAKDGLIPNKEVAKLPINNEIIPFSVKLTMVAMIYTLQGVACEFLSQTIYVKLVVNKATDNQLAIVSIMSYPWCLKLLWAPLQDAYFIPSIGRRKSWIIASYLGLTVVWAYFSINIQHMIDNLDIDLIAVVGVLTSFLLAFQDVSMDGWMIKLAANDKELSKFSWWCSFGYSLGGTFSFNLFTWFSSPTWCKDVFGIGPIINAEEFVIVVAFTFIVFAFIVYFVPESKDSIELQEEGNTTKQLEIDNQQQKKENFASDRKVDETINYINYLNEIDSGESFENASDEVPKLSDQKLIQVNQEQKQTNFQRILQKLRKFTKNKNLVFLLLILAFGELGFAYFDNLGPVEMLENGMNQNVYAFIWFISIFWEGVGGYCVAVFGQNREMRFYLVSCIIRILNSCFQWYIVSGFETKTLDNESGLILYGIQQNIDGIADSFNYVAIIRFCLRICDSEVEGSYIAILTSVFYSAPIWTSTLSLYLATYISQTQLSIMSLAYCMLFLAIFAKPILKLEKLKKECWELKEQ